MSRQFLSFLLFLVILCASKPPLFGQFDNYGPHNPDGYYEEYDYLSSATVFQKPSLSVPLERFELYSYDRNSDDDYAKYQYPLSLSLCSYEIRNANKGKYKIALEYNPGVAVRSSPRLRSYSTHWNLIDRLNEDDSAEDEEGEKKPQLLRFVFPEIVIVDIYTNYGRKDEKHRSIFLVLDPETEFYDLGEITF